LGVDKNNKAAIVAYQKIRFEAKEQTKNSIEIIWMI
jgi:hypothetical protein